MGTDERDGLPNSLIVASLTNVVVMTFLENHITGHALRFRSAFPPILGSSILPALLCVPLLMCSSAFFFSDQICEISRSNDRSCETVYADAVLSGRSNGIRETLM